MLHAHLGFHRTSPGKVRESEGDGEREKKIGRGNASRAVMQTHGAGHSVVMKLEMLMY